MTSHRSYVRALLLATLLGLTACGPDIPPDTFPGQPVTQRRDIFKQMLRAFEPMGLMVRGKAPYSAEKFAAHAAELARLSELPWAHFPTGSLYPPSKAKPVVWDKADEFAKAQKQYLAAVGALNNAAKAQPAQPPVAIYEQVLESCSSCHKAFRN